MNGVNFSFRRYSAEGFIRIVFNDLSINEKMIFTVKRRSL